MKEEERRGNFTILPIEHKGFMDKLILIKQWERRIAWRIDINICKWRNEWTEWMAYPRMDRYQEIREYWSTSAVFSSGRLLYSVVVHGGAHFKYLEVLYESGFLLYMRCLQCRMWSDIDVPTAMWHLHPWPCRSLAYVCVSFFGGDALVTGVTATPSRIVWGVQERRALPDDPDGDPYRSLNRNLIRTSSVKNSSLNSSYYLFPMSTMSEHIRTSLIVFFHLSTILSPTSAGASAYSLKHTFVYLSYI